MECNTNADAVQVNINWDSWVTQIKECLNVLEEQEEEEEEEKELCPWVFNVSRELLSEKPEAYIPQSVSIGPYHHWRSEIYHMDRHKLGAAYRFHKTINGLDKFQSLVVDEFKRHDWQIRSCYHKFIDYNEETLAWIMALDAVFLLQCLQFYVRHADVRPLGGALDPIDTDNSIFRDLMMLENQLPLFLMKLLLELQLGSKAKAEERLLILLKLVCQELSPFGLKVPENSNLHINERGHLLEVLYSAFVPLSKNRKPIGFQEDNDVTDPVDMSTVIPIEEDNDVTDPTDMLTVTKVFNMLWKLLSSILTPLVRLGLNWKVVQFLMKLPSLPGFSVCEKLFSLLLSERRTSKIAEESSSQFIPPSCNELVIPSAADLHFAGVKFSPTDGDLTTIQFDNKTATLYLPKLKFDTNTEVVLRNLIAFEASAAPGAVVFRRYTDFMNGMIDGIEDVKLLRENGIICNHLLSDREVANLWNSLGKCVSVTNVGYLDKVINDLNRYYHGKWKVVVVEFVDHYIFGSWKFLSLVAAAILLILTCLQAYCSVYDCRKWVK